MSKNSLHKIDQKEYLKKYLSGDKVKKKKKDKKHKKSSSVKVKIIDDDVNHLDTGPQIDEELLLTGDDAPQIVGEYIEENPVESKQPKWKSIGIKEEPQDECSSLTRSEENLWGKKSTKENSEGKKRSDKTPDYSPPRRKVSKRKDLSLSPPHRKYNLPSPQRKERKDKYGHRRRDSGDISPDFRNKIKREPITPDKSPHRRRHISEDDFSPPRREKNPSSSFSSKYDRRKYSDKTLPRVKSNHSSDHSPARKSNNRSNEESPLRERKHFDQSPPRKNTKRSTDQSPIRKTNFGQSPYQRDRNRSPDQSPPRKSRYHSPDTSPSRRKRTNSDQSPPRKGRKNLPDKSPKRERRSSQSPELQNRFNSADQSPPRRIKNSDQTPPRKNRHASPLPARHIKHEKLTPDFSPRRRTRWERQESEKSLSPPPTHKPKPGKTLEGKKAGLQDAQALHKESLERRKQENLLFEKMSSDISGRHAEVQVRSTGRKGRRAREAGEEDPEERKRKEEYEEKKKQLYERWGKGLKQIEDHKNRLLEQAHESSKPLARYEDDEDLERHLKEQERAEDPMLEYMRQKRKEKEKQSGKPQIPRYEGPYPENRFGIRPGYRWDGVDRSNGYEKKYFSVQNEKRARQDEAYKYSVEDM